MCMLSWDAQMQIEQAQGNPALVCISEQLECWSDFWVQHLMKGRH